jgi:hypothetical protein
MYKNDNELLPMPGFPITIPQKELGDLEEDECEGGKRKK